MGEIYSKLLYRILSLPDLIMCRQRAPFKIKIFWQSLRRGPWAKSQLGATGEGFGSPVRLPLGVQSQTKLPQLVEIDRCPAASIVA
jgi:hypothetical protein